MEEPRIRLVATADPDGGPPILTLYLNESGQLLLVRTLAGLAPWHRHVHLANLLTVAGTSDISEVDVVFVEGAGDVAHAPPS
jgi:hypothetical protein